MFQPCAKLLFVKRYCSPANGWTVFVDIDPSEEGRTGGKRSTVAARASQKTMAEEAALARAALEKLGVCVGRRAPAWARTFPNLTPFDNDHDIIALHARKKRALVVEVEGESSGQSEQKVYKAVGQVVAGLGGPRPEGFKVVFGIVVVGTRMPTRLRDCARLAGLGVFGPSLAATKAGDRTLFHPPRFSLDAWS